MFFKKWRAYSCLMAQKSHQNDWQNDQIATVMKEKQELEKKVEYQNEINEQLQAEISHVLIQTECNDCK